MSDVLHPLFHTEPLKRSQYLTLKLISIRPAPSQGSVVMRGWCPVLEVKGKGALYLVAPKGKEL